MKAKTIEELFGTLQQSIVDEWRKHLKTSKYSKHKALDEFYKDMPELVDALIEGYNGHTKSKVEDFKCILDAEKLNALEYLEELHEICQSGYDLLPDDAPEIKSNLDAIKDKIDSVMYQVRELKEQNVGEITDIKSYLKESMKNITDHLKDSLVESSSDEEVMIDNLSKSQKRKFIDTITKHVGVIGRDTVENALNALIGNNYKIAATNFSVSDDNTLTLDAYETTMAYDVKGSKWTKA